ncbi:MAG: 4Fe-4S binding protein [Deltaproteobacteria bacterium]|nr:4Fe-4S binding protein [Deltaproteobacteria bacterium]
MEEYFHSVKVDPERCRGSMRCMRVCPTEAIRIREGKAVILEDRCVDCGDCIRVCPERAIRSVVGSYEDISKFKYTVAIPSPSLYSQFGMGVSPNQILNGLKGLAFDDAYDIGRACEVYLTVLKEYLDSYSDNKPLISTLCPSIVRLIQIRFPDFMNNLLSLEAPRGIAGSEIKLDKAKELGLDPKEIGTIYITPCPAKMMALNQPQCKSESNLDGALAISDIYGMLFSSINKLGSMEELHNSTGLGISLSIPGGVITCINVDNAVAIDGIKNVMNVLDDLEHGKVTNIKYLELWACPGGCIGGPLAVENPYITKIKVIRLVQQFGRERKIKDDEVNKLREYLSCDVKLPPLPIKPLGRDALDAIKKVKEREAIIESLPKIDCGACGAPTCKAFAEDVVQGRAEILDCVFKLQDKIVESSQYALSWARRTPLSFRKRGKGTKLT